MIKQVSAAIAAVLMITLTACGTFSPPQATETTTTTTTEMTTVSTVTTVTVTDDSSEGETKSGPSDEERRQTAANTFIAEFYDSAISFEDTSKLVKEAVKSTSLEHLENVSNGTRKISLKGDNGSGYIDVTCIDISNCGLEYDPGYITGTFGDYNHGLVKSSMSGINDDDFTSNYRMTNTVVSKSKYQQYGSIQKTDGMATQFGYAETYVVLADGKMTVISGQFLSTDMMERQAFTRLLTSLREKTAFKEDT